MPEQQGKLTGWEQIAAYLEVSLRTAQVYGQKQGLPVHRVPGTKGRVWAIAGELDVWKNSTPSADSGVAVSRVVPAADLSFQESPIEDLAVPPPSRESDAGGHVPPPNHLGPDRRQWLRKAAFGAAALGISGTGLTLAVLRLLRPAPIPTAYRVAGATLIILGKDGKEIWRHEFAGQLDESVYNLTTVRSCAFADLDGDGRIETLFNCCLESKRPEQYLSCFDDRGKLLWNFHPSGTVADLGGREFLPPFYLNDFEVVPLGKGRQSKIVAACNHHFSFPAQVVMLDCGGNLLSRYWHRGHLTHIVVADLYGSGEPTVLLGGVNDAAEYKRATLLAVDHRSFSGGSVSPSGSPYFVGGLGTEKIEVFFPKTRVSEHKEFNRVNYVGLRHNRILVCVTEDLGEPGPWRVDYELDLNFNVTAVAFTDTLYTRYVEIFGDSRKAEEAVRRDEERCRNDVRVIRRT